MGILMAYMEIFMSPFAPEALNDFAIGNGLFIALMSPGLIIGMDEMTNMKSAIKHREFRASKDKVDLGALGDFFSYGNVILAGFVPVLLGTIMAADPSHDREWILNA